MPEAPHPRPAAAARTRRLDLERGKGIAILLVVLGHIVARQAPPGVEWYEPLRAAIYRFHMPFFLYLSGTVLVLSGAAAAPAAAFPALLRRRAQRLLLPFLLLGLLVLAAKLAAQPLVHVDNPPEGLAGGLRDLFWTTAHSPAVTIWYLAVLFQATLIALPLLRAGMGAGGLVLLGLLLFAIGLPPLLYLDRLAAHFVFFAAGIWVAGREPHLLPLFERRIMLWWTLFGLAMAAAAAGLPPAPWDMLVCGLLAIPALHGLVRLPPLARWRWPVVLGGFALSIYLFNTLAIGGTKALLIKAGLGWTAEAFWAHAILLTLAGLFLPILLKRLVLRRLPAVDRMTD